MWSVCKNVVADILLWNFSFVSYLFLSLFSNRYGYIWIVFQFKSLYSWQENNFEWDEWIFNLFKKFRTFTFSQDGVQMKDIWVKNSFIEKAIQM